MLWLGDTACKGMLVDMQRDGQGPVCSLTVSGPGHGNVLAVSDPNTKEMKVSGAPMGANMCPGPQGTHLGKGNLWSLFLGCFLGCRG